MTQNQIAYFNAIEQKRHNQMVENETQRANMAKEALDKRNQNINRAHYVRADYETGRANRAQEKLKETAIGVDYAKLAETQRSNLANEEINRFRARSDRMKAVSGSYLDYSTAGLRQSETALKDLEASYTIARTNLTEAEYATERARYYNEIEKVGLTQAQRDLTVMQTNLAPIDTWGKAVGSVTGGVGRLLANNTVDTSYSYTQNIDDEGGIQYVQLK